MSQKSSKAGPDKVNTLYVSMFFRSPKEIQVADIQEAFAPEQILPIDYIRKDSEGKNITEHTEGILIGLAISGNMVSGQFPVINLHYKFSGVDLTVRSLCYGIPSRDIAIAILIGEDDKGERRHFTYFKLFHFLCTRQKPVPSTRFVESEHNDYE